MKAISDLMGHLQGGSESQRRYVKRAKLLKLKEYMDRVSFGLRFVEIDVGRCSGGSARLGHCS